MTALRASWHYPILLVGSLHVSVIIYSGKNNDQILSFCFSMFSFKATPGLCLPLISWVTQGPGTDSFLDSHMSLDFRMGQLIGDFQIPFSFYQGGNWRHQRRENSLPKVTSGVPVAAVTRTQLLLPQPECFPHCRRALHYVEAQFISL